MSRINHSFQIAVDTTDLKSRSLIGQLPANARGVYWRFNQESPVGKSR
jgi:hypothetical protein